MWKGNLNQLKKIKDMTLRQVVLIDNFIHYCESHKDYLKSKEGKKGLSDLVKILERRKQLKDDDKETL